jgi:hypothetical protein
MTLETDISATPYPQRKGQFPAFLLIRKLWSKISVLQMKLFAEGMLFNKAQDEG